MPLADIVSQEAAIAALKSALRRDAVPQALLLVGPEGVGKTTAAVEFARALCCKAPVDADACGVCVSCRRIADGQHPDVSRIAPDGELTKIWQLWSRPGHPAGALENLSFAPIAGPRRVYLIEKAETLNEESANSLLKALEEPPPYAQFVLCAPSPTSVLATILSRCQLVRFTPVATGRIVDALTRRGLAPAEARLLANYAEGSPGRALRLAEAPDLRDQREALLDLAARISRSPGIAAFRLAEDLRNLAKPGKSKKGDSDGDEEKSSRGDIGRALDVLTAWYRDALVLAVRGPEAPILHEDRRDALLLAARAYPMEQLTEIPQHLFAFRRHLARNANAQIATEALLLKLTPRKA